MIHIYISVVNSLNQSRAVIVKCIFLSLLCLTPLAKAHLMVAQHGTLNVEGNGVFMVISLPISAFDGLDENKNGHVSMIEFNHHRTTITTKISESLILSENGKKRVLQGLILSPEIAHKKSSHVDTEAITQVTVMGKFLVENSKNVLVLKNALYGTEAQTESIKITVTRNKTENEHTFELTTENQEKTLFDS